MKSTVIMADKTQAEQVSTTLLEVTLSNGKKPFRRIETGNGFEITGPIKQPDGTWKREVVFRYTESPLRVDWNPDLIQIGR